MDKQIKDLTKSFQQCQKASNQPAKLKRAKLPVPSQPCHRLHTDYAGPVNGKMLLFLVDATTKWPEVVAVDSTTSSATITFLRSVFARFGHPVELVSDNGPQFASDEFRKFMEVSGIKHHMGAPYHPQSNGLAERAVQSVKTSVLKMEGEPGSLQTKILRFLLSYRNTPHSTTAQSPAMMLLGRPLRTRLDLLRPSSQPKRRDEIAAKFQPGDEVLLRNYQKGQPKWQSGKVERRIGSYLYLVRSGTIRLKRHVDQLLVNKTSVSDTPGTTTLNIEQPSVELEQRVTEEEPLQRPAADDDPSTTVEVPSVPVHVPISTRTSTRDRRAPAYLKDFVLNHVGSYV